MAIREEMFANFGACQLYQVIDDKGRPTQPDRWRLTGIKGVNTASYPFYVYVEDPATGILYPAEADRVISANSTRVWEVPIQFQNADPYSYNWGGGGMPPG